jgi:hypothetical protein
MGVQKHYKYVLQAGRVEKSLQKNRPKTQSRFFSWFQKRVRGVQKRDEKYRKKENKTDVPTHLLLCVSFL